jgi:hypothetical protein
LYELYKLMEQSEMSDARTRRVLSASSTGIDPAQIKCFHDSMSPYGKPIDPGPPETLKTQKT